ncbi:MAG: tetratricopeptide repeat protein [Acidobacteriota bacterium]
MIALVPWFLSCQRETGSSTSPAAEALELPADGEPVTWSEHVAPVVAKHCVGCHREGSMAPFSLTSAASARPWAPSIAREVAAGEMPPWLPSSAGLPLRYARGLSDLEREILLRWSRRSSTEDEERRIDTQAPAARWQLGEPDLVIEMPEPYELAAEGPDIIRNFVLPIPEATGRLVRAVELDPGNRRVVHHANVLADTRGRARQLDLDDPQPGYAGMVAAVAPGGHFLGWTPGKQPRELPEGTAWRVEPQTDAVLQLHLMPSGAVEVVQPRIALYFTEEEPRREPVVLHLGSTDIDLEPETRGTAVEDSWTVPYGFRLAAIYPHAHYLGESVKVSARPPDGQDTTLLDIPRWDFFWQDEYLLEREQLFPAGTELKLRVTYDNTADNPRNPFTPPQRVLWGPSSRDEMCDVWLTVFPEQPEELPLLRAAATERSLELSRDGLAERADAIDDSRAWASLARLDLELGDFTRAEVSFARALGRVAEPERESDHLGQLLHDLGLSRIGLDQPSEALDSFRAALETFGATTLENRELVASTHANLGTLHLVLGDPASARSALEQALRLAPNDALAWVRLGLSQNGLRQETEAERSYRKALDIDPRNAQAHAALGSFLARRGQGEVGKRHLLRALELDPLLAEAHKNLATLAALRGDLLEARRQLERALSIEPEDAVALHLLGTTAAQTNDLATAYASFEKAVAIDPRHPDAHRDWATLLSLQKRHREALPHWQRAVEASPADADAIAGLADGLVRAGRLGAARDLLRRSSRELGAQAPQLRELLRQVEELAGAG